MDVLAQMHYFENKLESLDAGDEALMFYRENPEELQRRLDECSKLKKQIIDSNLYSGYKESLLASIRKKEEKLNLAYPRGARSAKTRSKDSEYNGLFYLALGAIFGVVLSKIGEKALEKFMKDLAKEVVEDLKRDGVYGTMGRV